MSFDSSSYGELLNSITSRLLVACTSFIFAVCSSHVYPHFPYIQSSCVLCLCSCHLWYNQLYFCTMNQSQIKIKLIFCLCLFPPGMNWGLKDGSVYACFTAGTCVCASSQRCKWPLIPGQRSSTLSHLPFFPWLVSTAQCESQRHRTGHKTARYLHQTPLMRKVKAVTRTQQTGFSGNIQLWVFIMSICVCERPWTCDYGYV